ncbi:MAG: PaaI family thioesterase [Bacteroidetes bacterium]|jgi:1,4-dihydroxy-2-naphthoyl-CoA hydrolase|nr:PaaI family thioesterase [Bacteroidota bacterium]
MEHTAKRIVEWMRLYNQDDRLGLSSRLGMRLIKIEEGYLEGSMPVDDRTKQPFGILHGGASVALAETLGSIGSNILAPEGHVAVGLEINANHVRSVGEGEVICKAQLVHRGKQTHVWDIRLYDEQGQMNCICRFTAAIIPKPG